MAGNDFIHYYTPTLQAEGLSETTRPKNEFKSPTAENSDNILGELGLFCLLCFPFQMCEWEFKSC